MLVTLGPVARASLAVVSGVALVALVSSPVAAGSGLDNARPLVGGPSHPTATADGAGPELVGGAVDPATVSAGSPLTVVWSLRDGTTLASTSATALLFYGNGGLTRCTGRAQQLAGTPISGTYRSTCAVPAATPAGTYAVAVSARDTAGALLEAMAGTFRVIGADGRAGTSAGPELVRASFRPVQVVAGSSVTLEWSLTSTAGVTATSGSVLLTDGNGTAVACGGAAGRVGGTPFSGTYRATCSVPSTTPGGTYAATVSARDASGGVLQTVAGTMRVLGRADRTTPTTAPVAAPTTTSPVPTTSKALPGEAARVTGHAAAGAPTRLPARRTSPAPVDSTTVEPPANLSAQPGAARVTLRWSAPARSASPVTGYLVYRGTSSGGESGAGIAASGLQHSDLTALPGTTYYYVVLAMTASGLSAPSNEVRSAAGPAPASAPAAVPPTPGGAPAVPVTPSDVPTDVSATSGVYQVALHWAPPSAGSPVIAYYVRRGTSPGGETGAAVTTTDPSYVDASAVPGVTYFYVVQAMTAAGLSPPAPRSLCRSIQAPLTRGSCATTGPARSRRRSPSWSGSRGSSAAPTRSPTRCSHPAPRPSSSRPNGTRRTRDRRTPRST